MTTRQRLDEVKRLLREQPMFVGTGDAAIELLDAQAAQIQQLNEKITKAKNYLIATYRADHPALIILNGED